MPLVSLIVFCCFRSSLSSIAEHTHAFSLACARLMQIAVIARTSRSCWSGGLLFACAPHFLSWRRMGVPARTPNLCLLETGRIDAAPVQCTTLCLPCSCPTDESSTAEAMPMCTHCFASPNQQRNKYAHTRSKRKNEGKCTPRRGNSHTEWTATYHARQYT